MVADEVKRPEDGDTIDEFPEVHLDCAVDESSQPTRVTIFDPESEHVATSWISVDYDTGVSLQQIQ